jgi:hypothetical protein
MKSALEKHLGHFKEDMAERIDKIARLKSEPGIPQTSPDDYN